MRDRRASALGIMALLLSGFGPAAAQPVAQWVTFTDPVEHAFTIEVPQGWRIAGGIRRYAASEAPAWVTAQSPDGSIELFLNDPSVGNFTLPTAVFAEGAQVPGVHNRPWTVMRYRPGAEYAAKYGLQSLPAACQDVRQAGMQARPNVEAVMRQTVQGASRLDGGEADFTCTRGGRALTATVIAGTALTNFPGGGGVWQVPVLFGGLSPPGQEAQAAEVLLHMQGSYKADPQFLAALRQAGEQELPPPAPLPGRLGGGVTPYRPIVPVGPRCDDLQQQRICNMNDGHLVSSGGCLKCVSP